MKKIGPLLLVPCLLGTSSCSFLTDPFTYTAKDDQLSASKITEAAGMFRGDGDKGARLSITLQCKFEAKQQPSPFADTTIKFLLADPKGQPKELKHLSVKFDDAAPSGDSFLRKNDMSNYLNASEQYYVNMAALTMPENDREGALFRIVLAKDDAYAHRLAALAIAAKRMMVRYETGGGLINTVTIPIGRGSFRKVLSDCGWDKMGAIAPSGSTTAQLPTEPAQPTPTASGSPPAAIVNDPKVKARLARTTSPIVWTEDDDVQGMQDCWTASEDIPDHRSVIDRYCVGSSDNAVYAYDAARDSWSRVSTPLDQAAPSTANLYNVYASIPTGNKTSKPQADAIISTLRQCGIQVRSDSTNHYRGLTPNLTVVLSGPYSSRSSASSDLNRANGCSVRGYIKTANFTGGE